MKSLVFKTVCAVGFMASSMTMQAAIIQGQLNFSGGVRVIGTTTIDFLPAGPPNGSLAVTPDPGNFLQTGSFSGLTGTGSILDLSSATAPAGSNVNIPGFLSSFTGFPGLNFTLTQILPGNIPNTPFSFNQSAGGTNITFSTIGTVSDGSSSPASSFIGQFSSQFPGQTVAQVLASLSSAGFVQDSFAATFLVAPPTGTPEPGTTMLLVSGSLLLLAGGMFRRKVKQ